MKILADENIEREIINSIRQVGFEVISIAESSAGIADSLVLDAASKEQAILLTNDKDFGELVFRQKLDVNGVILIRLPGLPLNKRIEKILECLKSHPAELGNAFTVVSEVAVRIRKL